MSSDAMRTGLKLAAMITAARLNAEAPSSAGGPASWRKSTSEVLVQFHARLEVRTKKPYAATVQRFESEITTNASRTLSGVSTRKLNHTGSRIKGSKQYQLT